MNTKTIDNIIFSEEEVRSFNVFIKTDINTLEKKHGLITKTSSYLKDVKLHKLGTIGVLPLLSKFTSDAGLIFLTKLFDEYQQIILGYEQFCKAFDLPSMPSTLENQINIKLSSKHQRFYVEELKSMLKEIQEQI